MTTDGLHKTVIKSFRSRQLKRFFEREDARSLPPAHLKRIRLILFHLHSASDAKDMDHSGYGLHKIGGNYAGFWSVSVQGPWRIIFRFEGEDVADVDYLDYH